MKTGNFFTNLKRSFDDNRKGLATVVAASAATAVLVTASSGSAIVPNNCCTIQFPQTALPLTTSTDSIRLTTPLAQSKFVQGGNGQASVEISIDSPAASAVDRRPTDFVVVLDRSGSMSADNRLPYAKSAIRDLISRLQEGDRLALVTFDSTVDTRIPLSAVNENFKRSSQQIVDSISVGGSTNISEALTEAARQLPAVESGRIRKVMLLSDGEANVGIVNPEALGQLAHSLTEKSAVLSTIGMGLGFNERTMSLLADRGMGNYSYLESLEKLGSILARDVDSTRAVYAQASRLDLLLPEGAKIVDAGGYPFSAIGGLTNGFRIETGQLAGSAKKSFFVTVQLPTGSTGEYSFGAAKLAYDIDGSTREISAGGPQMVAAIIPPERAAETAASINQELYRKSWAQNNLGLMKSKVSQLVAAGKKDEADKQIGAYRSQVQQAELEGKVAIMDAPTAQAIDQIQADTKDAFSGGASEQVLKQNRYGKKYHMEAREAQRAN